MKISNFIIRPANEFDKHYIASIHFNSLGKDAVAILGIKYLEDIFYSYLFSKAATLCFVAIDKDTNRVCGFVIGGPEQNTYKHMILDNFLKTIRSIFISTIKKPENIFYFFSILILLFFGKGYKYQNSDFELQYIAIEDKWQGKGVGRALAKRILTRASKSYKKCIVKTLISTPINIKFYEKIGFKKCLVIGNRIWLEFKFKK